MKRYRFRLETLLRLRYAEQEQARIALAAEHLRVRQLLSARDAQAEHYQELAGLIDGTDVASFLIERQEAEIAASCLADAELAASKAMAQAALAQRAWFTASQRVKALERLEERSRFSYNEDLRREEIAVVDDIVTARFSLHETKSPS